MPRPTTSSGNRRVQVRSSDAPNQLGRSLSPTASGAPSNNLKAIADALQVSLPAVATHGRNKNRADSLEAAADFQTGTLNPEGSAAYHRAATRLRAEADWVKNEPEIDRALEELDLDNMSPDELSVAIDDLYRAQYEGLDDPEEAAVVLPLMDKFRKKKTQEYIARQADIVFTNQAADLEVLFKNRYETVASFNEAVRAEGGKEVPIDYQGFHTKIRELDYGGKTTNELFYTIVANQAIERGDPGLLENLPDKWKDGTSSIKNIPAYNDRLLNATVRAEARQLSNIKARAKAEEDAQKESLRSAGIALVNQLAGSSLGDSERLQAIRDYSLIPGAKPSSVIALYNASKSLRDDGEKRSTNYEALSQLTHKIFSGEADESDIFDAYSQGSLGEVDSPQAATTFRQLLTDLKGADRLSATGDKDKFNAYLKGLSGKFVPSGFISQSNGAVAALKSDAELAYRRYVFEDGLNPQDAYKKSLGEFLPQLQNAQGNIGGGQVPSMALSWTTASPEDRTLLARDMASEDGIEDQVKSLVTTDVLSEDQAVRLLEEIAAQM